MTKKSSGYWKKRFSDLENAANQYGQTTFHQIEPAFDKAQRQIQEQIEGWYQRYANNNGITMAEARKQLSAAELKELQWDVQEYIKYGQENAVNQQWMKQLENASARYHIGRLEALKLRTQQSLEVAFGNELDSLDSMLRTLYRSGYYHTCFEVQKGFNIGWEIGQIDERKLQKVISKPWAADGRVFSDRVWRSKTVMVNDLHQQLTRTIIQGKAPDEAIKSMSKYLQNKTRNAKYQAGRLVMTEQAFISSAAQKDAFHDLDVEKFEIVATLDSHTSEICREMDGKHFPMKDFQPGVTAPPFHVWCRSTTVPYFDENFGELGERAARGKDGKTYYVPADMKYKEWEEAFVADSISEQTKKEFVNYYKVLGNKSPTIEEFSKIKYNEDEWKMFKAFTSSVKSGELSALADFDLYKEISREMDEKLLGVVTSNNLIISGKSNHSIARVIGSIEQRRNGVQVSDILDSLTNKDSEILPVKEMKNGKSQKFRNKVVEVSVNPDTGIIIQVNPVHKRRKKAES